MTLRGNQWIPVSHGRLEAISRPSTKPGAPAALVLHPHPLHEGTMHNKVVYRTAKVLESFGYGTLRFNFRGVGQSTGRYDHGVGETEDAEAALQFLLAEHPHPAEVIVAGFSFGSVIGLRIGCADSRVDRVVAIGVPLRLDNLACLLTCTKPKLFLHGEADSIAPLAPLEAYLDQLPAMNQNHLVTIPGANHFFDHHAIEFREQLERFIASAPVPASTDV
jgi:alpha/beta superfamily hydrolase